MNEIIEMGRRVLDIEIAAMNCMKEALDSSFVQIVDCISECKGKVVFTGIGKPGHICKKLAATFSSLGTPSFYLHPAEAQHGDLGMISSDDVVIAISFSGESDEIIKLIPNIKLIGAKLIGITAKNRSTLGKSCDIVQVLPEFEEACYMHLAPTSSTTVELAYGDAVALAVAKKNGFKKEDFATFHPAGALGKKLILKVNDVMHSGRENSVVNISASAIEAIVEMSTKRLGAVSVVNDEGFLEGIITDGDLRRALVNKIDIYAARPVNIMTENPKYITSDMMAIEALRVIKEKKISALPVLDDSGRAIGMVTINDLISAGLVL